MLATSDNILARDAATVWHPFMPEPWLGPKAVFTRGRGAHLFDEKGKSYYDATSSWWCNTHGHCHPRLVEALRRQAGELDQMLFSPHTHPVAVELAEALIRKLGPPFEKVFFSDDGSTAVEAALKMALQYWRNRGHSRNEPRDRFLSVHLGYHGDTMGAVSVGFLDDFHRPFSPAKFEVEQATAPYCYRCPLGQQYPGCAEACLDETERKLAEMGGRIAALIVEPLVLGAGGMIAYPVSYLERLTELAKRAGALVIFDEVFTGFGRTGTFFAMERCRHLPDIVCLSKGLTGGMIPLAVTAASAEVYDAFRGGREKAFYHGHTFTANALGCAVARESLKVFEEEDVLTRNRKLEAVLASETPRFRDLPWVGEVRHLGMIWALELVMDRKSRLMPSPANGPGWKIAEKLWEQGVWIRPLNNVVYVLPPYCTTESDLRDVLSMLYSEVSKDEHFG